MTRQFDGTPTQPSAQAEARAIVSAYFKGSSAYDDSAIVKDIAAALGGQ